MIYRTSLGLAEHVEGMGRRFVYRDLVVKDEGKRPLGRPRRRWEDDIKTDLQAVRWGSMDCTVMWLSIGKHGLYSDVAEHRGAWTVQ
jgi:hypothetical protein